MRTSTGFCFTLCFPARGTASSVVRNGLVPVLDGNFGVLRFMRFDLNPDGNRTRCQGARTPQSA